MVYGFNPIVPVARRRSGATWRSARDGPRLGAVRRDRDGRRSSATQHVRTKAGRFRTTVVRSTLTQAGFRVRQRHADELLRRRPRAGQARLPAPGRQRLDGGAGQVSGAWLIAALAAAALAAAPAAHAQVLRAADAHARPRVRAADRASRAATSWRGRSPTSRPPWRSTATASTPSAARRAAPAARTSASSRGAPTARSTPGSPRTGKLIVSIAPSTESDIGTGIVVLPDRRLRVIVGRHGRRPGISESLDIAILGLNPDGSPGHDVRARRRRPGVSCSRPGPPTTCPRASSRRRTAGWRSSARAATARATTCSSRCARRTARPSAGSAPTACACSTAAGRWAACRWSTAASTSSSAAAACSRWCSSRPTRRGVRLPRGPARVRRDRRGRPHVLRRRRPRAAVGDPDTVPGGLVALRRPLLRHGLHARRRRHGRVRGAGRRGRRRLRDAARSTCAGASCPPTRRSSAGARPRRRAGRAADAGGRRLDRLALGQRARRPPTGPRRPSTASTARSRGRATATSCCRRPVRAGCCPSRPGQRLGGRGGHARRHVDRGQHLRRWRGC